MTTPMHLVADLVFARNFAARSGKRVVVVVPPKAVEDVLGVFVAQASEEDRMGGRTIFFKDGGSLVLCPADGDSEELMPFAATFIAWDGKVGLDARNLMAPWRDRATQVFKAAAS